VTDLILAELSICNGSERTARSHAWLFSAGAYATERAIVFADSIEDGLEYFGEWCKEHAPGLFSPPDYADAAKDLGIAWPTEDEATLEKVREHAETDHTYTESGWFLSWEWFASELSLQDTRAAVVRAVRDEQAEYAGPGKFEGEPAWVPYVWGTGADEECFVEGRMIDIYGTQRKHETFGSETFTLRDLFPELAEVAEVALFEDEQGFVRRAVPSEVRAAEQAEVAELPENE
jgi:hypothetical protein